MSRRVWFVIAILLGVIFGLTYGWVINPVKYVDTSPDTLRSDYKVDYVLMVAEVYHADGDIVRAVQRLAIFGDPDPLNMVQDVILQANQFGYSADDVELLMKLDQVLETRLSGG
jgi:hypothetical protein